LEKTLYPTRRIGRLAFLVLLWIVLTFRLFPTWRTGGAMLSFICLMAILLTAASLIPGATSLKLSSHGFTVRTWFRDESFAGPTLRNSR